jgi:hypothetical protein
MLNGAVGAFFMLVGVLMMVFHRQARQLDEEIYPPFLRALNPFRPRGKALTVVIIAFGALSFLGGLIVLIVNFVEP